MDRPIISQYQDVVAFIADMLQFQKVHKKHFSIHRKTKELRRVSPSLISLILKRQRRITFDRAEDIGKLLDLTPSERHYFRDWIGRLNGDQSTEPMVAERGSDIFHKRKIISNHILSDWINVYVKDAFQLKRVKVDPMQIYAVLGGIANQKRIDKAVNFLLRLGYLRRNAEGEIVEDSPLHVVDQKIPSEKVRQFHKGALKMAINSIDQYPPKQRYANALILPLDEKGYQELTQIIEEVAEKFQKFAEKKRDGEALYQLIINLSPTGDVHG